MAETLAKGGMCGKEKGSGACGRHGGVEYDGSGRCWCGEIKISFIQLCSCETHIFPYQIIVIGFNSFEGEFRVLWNNDCW